MWKQRWATWLWTRPYRVPSVTPHKASALPVQCRPQKGALGGTQKVASLVGTPAGLTATPKSVNPASVGGCGKTPNGDMKWWYLHAEKDQRPRSTFSPQSGKPGADKLQFLPRRQKSWSLPFLLSYPPSYHRFKGGLRVMNTERMVADFSWCLGGLSLLLHV